MRIIKIVSRRGFLKGLVSRIASVKKQTRRVDDMQSPPAAIACRRCKLLRHGASSRLKPAPVPGCSRPKE